MIEKFIFSTTFLQRVVDDEYRGRVFAAEMAIVTLILSLSTYCAGATLEAGLNLRHVALVLGVPFSCSGCKLIVVSAQDEKVISCKKLTSVHV